MALRVAMRRTPCSTPQPPRSLLDPIQTNRRPIGIALSGGGLRATLKGLGVLRLLADLDLLRDVRHVASVSVMAISESTQGRSLKIPTLGVVF